MDRPPIFGEIILESVKSYEITTSVERNPLTASYIRAKGVQKCEGEWLVSDFTPHIFEKFWKVFVQPDSRNFLRGIKGTPKEDTYEIWSKSKQNNLSIYLFLLSAG